MMYLPDSVLSIGISSVVNYLPQAIYWKTPEGIFLGCNEALLTLFGIEDTSLLIGRHHHEIAWSSEVPHRCFEIEQQLSQNSSSSISSTLEIQSSESQKIWLEVQVRKLDRCTLVVIEDKSKSAEASLKVKRSSIVAEASAKELEEGLIQAKRQNRLLQLMREIAVISNEASALEASSIKKTMKVCLERICYFTGWPIGHVYFYQEDKDRLTPSRIWHVDDSKKFRSFITMTEHLDLPRGVGLPGRVLLKGQPIWVKEVADYSNCPRTGAARDVGIKSGFAFPVTSGSGILAVLEFFSEKEEEPDDKLLNAMFQSGVQLGHMIERRRKQRELLKITQLAESANIAKSDFLANMSHELRTPMSGVIGMAHLLLGTFLTEEQREYVQAIEGSSGMLLTLLNDILDFSKIEADALTLEAIACDTKSLFSEPVQLLTPLALQKALNLTLDFDPALLPQMMGDPARLKQIVNNLVGNAVKFTEKGHVKIYVTPELVSNRPHLACYIEDTGIGIRKNKLNQIFEKFTQGDSSISRKYGGTGLGLAITKRLVTLMGGHIGVKTTEGAGSTFWFKVPMAEAKETAHPPESKTTTCMVSLVRVPASEARILLAEDNAINRLFAVKLLQQFGFQHMDIAENGNEVIEKWRQNSCHAIFMDCQMPEKDGYEATRFIRSEERNGCHIPIIAMTANAMVGDKEKCLKVGMDDYLSKPLNPELLQSILHEWFILKDPSVTSPQLDTGPNSLSTIVMRLQEVSSADRSEEQELASAFLDEAQRLFEKLENSYTLQHLPTWKNTAHTLKGASSNLGAKRLAELCWRAEQAPAVDAETLYSIKHELAGVKTFLSSHYSGVALVPAS